MAGRDRVAALQRARQRQRRVEEQTARTVRTYAAADRARETRERVLARADQRVADAVDAATVETARLADTCGSADAAAEILGLDPREVRRAVAASERAQAMQADRHPGVDS